jgi:hypothetical protein
VLRESLLRDKNWKAIAAQQRKQQFGAAAKALARQQLQTMMQSFDLLCQIEEQREQQHKAATGSSGSSSSGSSSLLERGGAEESEVQQATVRVVCSRQVCAHRRVVCGSRCCTHAVLHVRSAQSPLCPPVARHLRGWYRAIDTASFALAAAVVRLQVGSGGLQEPWRASQMGKRRHLGQRYQASLNLHLLLLLCRMQVGSGGLWEPWCEFSASLDPAKPSEPVSISAGDSSSSSSKATTSSSRGGMTVNGCRYRLAALQEDDTRALPTKGKVGMLYNNSRLHINPTSCAAAYASFACNIQTNWFCSGWMLLPPLPHIQFPSWQQPFNLCRLRTSFFGGGGALFTRRHVCSL